MTECPLDLTIHISNGKDLKMHQIHYKASKDRSMTFHKSITTISIFQMITKKNNLKNSAERGCSRNHHKDKSTNTIIKSNHLQSQNKHLLKKLMMLQVPPVPKTPYITLIITLSCLNNTKTTINHINRINRIITVHSNLQITFNHQKLLI